MRTVLLTQTEGLAQGCLSSSIIAAIEFCSAVKHDDSVPSHLPLRCLLVYSVIVAFWRLLCNGKGPFELLPGCRFLTHHTTWKRVLAQCGVRILFFTKEYKYKPRVHLEFSANEKRTAIVEAIFRGTAWKGTGTAECLCDATREVCRVQIAELLELLEQIAQEIAVRKNEDALLCGVSMSLKSAIMAFI